MERQTARKVRITSLTQGSWVKNEGMEPSYIVTPYGEKVSRARVIGTAVAKFVAEDQTFASLTIDDGSDTIRAKTFKGVKPLDTPQIGELLDVIGKVREWNGEIYMIPEVVARVDNPNIELLRHLEIAHKLRSFTPEASPATQKEGVRKIVLALIEKETQGISYDAILKNAGHPEDVVEKVITDLLDEGVCYEPSPGKIRKI